MHSPGFVPAAAKVEAASPPAAPQASLLASSSRATFPAITLAVTGATIVGTVLRLITPGTGPLWRDEALFIFVMRLPTLGDLLTFLYEHESHPPLFYLLMRAWAAIAGQSENSLAVLPIAFSLGLIPLVYWIGARTLGRSAGVIACWIVAVHPVLIFHSVQLRPYSLFTLLALLSAYTLYRLIEGPGRRACLAYAVSSLALLYVHHWGWLLLASQGTLLIIARLASGRSIERSLAFVAMAWAMIAVGYLPLLRLFVRHSQHSGHFPDQVGLQDAIVRLANIGVSFSPILAGIAILVLVAGAVSIRRHAQPTEPPSWWNAYLLLALPALVAVTVAVPLSHSSNLLVGHTMTVLVPFVAYFIACGVVALVTDRRFAVLSLLLCLLVSSMFMTAISYTMSVKSNARALALAVASKARPDDIVMIVPDRFAPSFNYYFPLANQQIGFPFQGRQETLYFDDWYSRVTDPKALAASLDSISAFRARNARVWLIVERFLYEDSLPNGLVIPSRRARDAYRVEPVRIRQIDLALRNAYGAPDTLAVHVRRQRGIENLRAILYSPTRDPK